MAVLKTTTRIPNALVILMDPTADALPDVPRGSLVGASPSALAIGTQIDVDGPTSITVVTPPEDLSLPGHLVFEGAIRSDSGRLHVSTVYWDTLLTADVEPGQHDVRIYANNVEAPDQILVQIS